jgi:hypothetical protein
MEELRRCNIQCAYYYEFGDRSVCFYNDDSKETSLDQSCKYGLTPEIKMTFDQIARKASGGSFIPLWGLGSGLIKKASE